MTRPYTVTIYWEVTHTQEITVDAASPTDAVQETRTQLVPLHPDAALGGVLVRDEDGQVVWVESHTRSPQ